MFSSQKGSFRRVGRTNVTPSNRGAAFGRQREPAFHAGGVLGSTSAGFLEERLHQIVVFELRESGSTEYSTMTLRALYNYVVSTITEACKQANFSRRAMQGSSATMSFASLQASAPVSSSGPSLVPSSGPSLASASGPVSSSGPSLASESLSESSPVSLSGPGSISGEFRSTSLQDRTRGRHISKPSMTSIHEPLSPRAAQSPAALPDRHRERLGGYLHPRDMRRLVTPFSSSNEPQLMVRRHVMLLNFDPLRAVVLKDRLLVLVPDGADSILIDLEKKVRGGIVEMKNQVFGSSHSDDRHSPPMHTKNHDKLLESPSTLEESSSHSHHSHGVVGAIRGSVEKTAKKIAHHAHHQPNHHSNAPTNLEHDATPQMRETDEWEEIQRVHTTNMPFELQSVDAVLQTVTAMLLSDARRVHSRAIRAMSDLRGDAKSNSAPGDHAQERLRLHKDEVNMMEGRVQGFVRAMNEVLDDDEDMALMNLERLLTHPERFIQPVSPDVLHEESDEPELILEAYLQQALSIVNELDLLKSQIMTTEEQINMTLDAIRNRLLYINTLLSVASLCVSIGSFVGSVFGMNLTNHLENAPNIFVLVVVATLVGMFILWVILSWMFYQAASNRSNFWKHSK